MGKTVEFRGCDNLVFAEVLTDDANGITFGAVRSLAPVAEIAKTVETNSETHFYDNVGQIIIRSEGSDEITLTVPVLPLDILAAVTGKTYDAGTGAFIDGESAEKYYAIGYRLRLTDGSYRYVWRNKGAFAIPNSTSATENDGTDTNNQQLVYTGVKSIYEFTNGGRAKGVVVDERDGKYDCTDWFNAVVTPDVLISGDTSFVTGVTVSPATATATVGATKTLTASVSVTSGHAPYAGNIRWQTTNEQVATVTSAGLVTAVGVGTAIIIAEVGNYASGCIVTVSAGS